MTDVPASIAGFYYQILIACKELTEMASKGTFHENDGVGIEHGADIRIKQNNGSSSSIEAKFYKDNFNENSDAITHTISNFFKQSFNDDALIFNTNVDITPNDLFKINFSENWNTISEIEIGEYLNYIHYCLIKDEINHKTETKKRFDDFKNRTTNIQHENGNKYLYNDKYIKEIVSNGTDKNAYYDISIYSEDEIKIFIRKFVFKKEAELDKWKSIIDLKAEIETNINNYLNRKNIAVVDHLKLLDLLIEAFLDTTVNLEFITLKNLDEICVNANNAKLRFLDKVELKAVINKIENDEVNFINDINYYFENDLNKALPFKSRYIAIRNEFLKELRDINNYYNLIKKFSLNNEETPYTFIKIIRYITTLSFFKAIEVNEVGLNKTDIIKNIFLGSDEYCFKSSETVRNFELFVNYFINSTQLNFTQIDANCPIVIDAILPDTQYPCKQKKQIEIIPDIAGVTSTSELLLLYNNLDYRCTNCIVIDKDNDVSLKKIQEFTNCPKIKQGKL